MFRRLATAVFCTFLAIAPAAIDSMDDAVAALKKDEPYQTARLGLFEAGWRPAPAPYDGGESGRCAGDDALCAAYPEVDQCAGTGLAPCNMRFAKPDGTILVVTTLGEIMGMIVSAWTVEKS